MATTRANEPWKIDLKRFRTYLHEKYDVEVAYYFVGLREKKFTSLYKALEAAGFSIVFREHDPNSHAKKRGNVDTDVVFSMMRDMHETEVPKLVLVSGDGDYLKTVRYLIENGRFARILPPPRGRTPRPFTRA